MQSRLKIISIDLRRPQIIASEPAASIMRVLDIVARQRIDTAPVCETLPAEFVLACPAGHVDTTRVPLDAYSTIRALAVLGVGPRPALGLLVVRISILALTVVLIVGHAFVPRYLVGETHLKGALLAVDVRLHVFRYVK